MAYATTNDVTTLVPSLSGTGAEDAAAALLEAASDFVDRYTGRTWVAGTVTGEVRTIRLGEIRTTRHPVTGVTSLAVRAPVVGAASTVLVAGSTYDVLDAAIGRIAVLAVDGSLVTISYTTGPIVPDDIKAVTAMLAGHWSRGAVDNSGSIFSKIKAGSAELTYREQTDVMPRDIKAILDGYRAAINFA